MNSTSEEYFKKVLSNEGLDGVLVSSVAQITHLTGYSNFSINEREAYLLITKDMRLIFTDARYTEAIERLVRDFDLVEISQSNPLKNILSKLKSELELSSLGIEEGNLTVKEFKSLKKIFKKLKGIEIFEGRAIKDAHEIEQIEKACQIGDKAFDYILTRIREGVSEKELAFELELFIRERGGDLSFDTIVAYSENSSVPHHNTGQDVLKAKKGQFVKLDFGVRVENYCSDMTRTVFFGKASDKQIKIYKTVLAAQEKAVKFLETQIKKGKATRGAEVDKSARDYIISQGYPSIPHSLGHGIGVQVHEHPFLSSKSREILREGMVFSIEPGIYIPGYGGVRIEDLFVIEKSGLRQLTGSPKNIIEL